MRWNPVLAVLSFLGAGGLAGLPFLRVASNRLVSGEAVPFFAVLRGPAWWWVVGLLALLLASFLKPGKPLMWWVLAMTTGLIAGLVWLAGAHALYVAQTESSLTRTSLGGAFWVMLLVLWLIATDALQRLQLGYAAATAVLAALMVPAGCLLLAGRCDELSIMKEYFNRSELFLAAVARHMQIVVLALLPTLFIALPLGWAVYKNAAVRQSLFPVLNIIQTLPSIALFGLLMAPLAVLAAAFPALAHAGISGVGLAPGVIALTLYSLLPVVRATLAGLEQVPSAVLDAARGMGMTPSQMFWRIEVPLAWPVLLVGIHTATIQAIGLAAVTALIGAGGLGALMFEGLFSSAQDLVLLGVVPMIALAVLTDSAFKVLIHFTKGPQP